MSHTSRSSGVGPLAAAASTGRRAGFTLVELLVVIGIIALLISILLPSLNRARQSANSIKCQSNLRGMWQAATVYAAQNRDLLPWGQVTGIVENGVHTGFGFSGPNDYPYDWADTISLMLGSTPSALVNQRPAFHSGVFDDPDANVPFIYLPANFSPGPMVYTAHPKIFTRTDFRTGPNATDPYFKQRNIGSIRRPSEVMAIWDGSQVTQQTFAPNTSNSIPIAESLDGNRFNSDHGMHYPTPMNASWTPERYEERVALGGVPGNTMTELRTANADGSEYANVMRFRHFNNTVGNFCFADGHVESRKLGEVKIRDICLNPK